jgi:hypothetical protein
VSSLPDLLLGVLAAECMGVGNGTDSRRGRSSIHPEAMVGQEMHMTIAAAPFQQRQTLCGGQAVHSETAPTYLPVRQQTTVTS